VNEQFLLQHRDLLFPYYSDTRVVSFLGDGSSQLRSHGRLTGLTIVLEHNGQRYSATGDFEIVPLGEHQDFILGFHLLSTQLWQFVYDWILSIRDNPSIPGRLTDGGGPTVATVDFGGGTEH
jgi:hypothetical protein